MLFLIFCIIIYSKLSLGPGTYEISTELFEINRKRLVERLQNICKDSIVVLQGGNEIPFYDTDTAYIFRQVNTIIITL